MWLLFPASRWFPNPLKDSLDKIPFVTLGAALGQVALAFCHWLCELLCFEETLHAAAEKLL